ncbi:MAG: TonB-dependent receptor, partial [Acidobacteriota bacterium]|nr:TonB-dependent receptor [Acidobacteriota bacterium]
PGQQNAFNVTTAFDPETGGLSNSGTVPSNSAPAALRGGEDLQPEDAVNFSAGLVVDKGEFTLTADVFHIDVDDRIALSETFRQCNILANPEPGCVTDAEIEQLLSGGFVEARNLKNFRFFVNDFATQTQGLDVVGTWTPPELGGDTSFSLVFNYTKTEVTDHNPDTVGPFRIATIEQGLPKFRYNLNNTSIALGVQNLLNTYPEDNPGAADGVGNRYGQFSPFGFNGAYYYVRFNYAWGQRF